MEEGIPPLPPRPNYEPPPNPVIEPSSAIVPFNKATYVVQVPKEQIFRVPPPENAHIVEEYRNRMKNRKKTSPHVSRLAYTLLILLVVVLLCLSGLLIFYLVVKPSVPYFAVDHISAVGPLHTRPDFNVMLKVQNPSPTMDFHYKEDGRVDLSHHGKQIALGYPATFYIGHRDTTEINLSLRGSKVGLPKEIDTRSKGLKEVVPLSLSAKFLTKLGFGALQMRKKELNVNCDLKVSNWGKKMHIVSQTCKAELQ